MPPHLSEEDRAFIDDITDVGYVAQQLKWFNAFGRSCWWQTGTVWLVGRMLTIRRMRRRWRRHWPKSHKTPGP